jgi:hypothetical protein
MPGDFPIQDPQKIWQNQSTEPLKMSAADLRRKALAVQSKARFAALFTIVIGIVLSVFFAWTFIRAHTVLARMGWGLLSLWGIYAAYHVYKWTWPRNFPQDSPISTCIEFCRRELERQRDYNRRWWRSGLPFFLLLGIVMAVVGTGARNVPPPTHPLLNALPFFLLLAIWAVAFFVLKKKHGRQKLQQEIDELRAFETENRS